MEDLIKIHVGLDVTRTASAWQRPSQVERPHA